MRKEFAKKVVLFILGLVVGGVLVFFWLTYLQRTTAEGRDFSYSVVSSTLRAENVAWKEYPQFRTVEFTLNGELVLTVPEGAQLSPEGLADAGTLTEEMRRTKTLGYGAERLVYDEVVYRFTEAVINANLPNVYEKEKDATYGYELAYTDGEQTIVYGYILPMCEEFHVCTKEETRYWEYPQSLEFGLLSLSRTYIKGDINSSMPVCPTVKLEKREDSYALTMINEGENRLLLNQCSIFFLTQGLRV